MWPIAANITRSVVCMLVHWFTVQKRVNRLRCHFGGGEGLTHVGPRNPVLDGVQIRQIHLQLRGVKSWRCGLLLNYFWTLVINTVIIVMLCSPGSVEYRETVTIINRILEEHESTMVFAKPDLDWCDLAVQVCVARFCITFSTHLVCGDCWSFRCIGFQWLIHVIMFIDIIS